MDSEFPSETVTLGSSDDENVSEAVITAVADAKGVSPMDVTPPLYDVVDPDALEAIVASMTRGPDESAGRVEFSYGGYAITVTCEGQVSVTPDGPIRGDQSSGQ